MTFYSSAVRYSLLLVHEFSWQCINWKRKEESHTLTVLWQVAVSSGHLRIDEDGCGWMRTRGGSCGFWYSSGDDGGGGVGSASYSHSGGSDRMRCCGCRNHCGSWSSWKIWKAKAMMKQNSKSQNRADCVVCWLETEIKFQFYLPSTELIDLQLQNFFFWNQTLIN